MSATTPAVSQYAFHGDARQQQISFPEGAHILIDRRHPEVNGWLRGSYQHQKGWFPASYVTTFTPPQPSATKYDSEHTAWPETNPSGYASYSPTSVRAVADYAYPEDDGDSGFASGQIMGGQGNYTGTSAAMLNHSPWQELPGMEEAIAERAKQNAANPFEQHGDRDLTPPELDDTTNSQGPAAKRLKIGKIFRVGRRNKYGKRDHEEADIMVTIPEEEEPVEKKGWRTRFQYPGQALKSTE